MNRWKQSLLVLLSATLSLSTAMGKTAALQLDTATLIDTLAREGMGRLLDHLAETDSGDDPVITRLIQVGQLRVRYSDTKLERHERIAAFDQMLDEMRSLIRSFPEHEQCPLWQTDLASRLLYDGLQAVHQYAGAFNEFGVPTVERRKAFESVVAEAFEEVVAAEIKLFHLKSDLPRQPDHEAKRVETGLWDRMINEYDRTKTPMLLALSAYYVALLEDDHPYYQNLNNPKIPRQMATAQAERARLLGLTIDRLTGLVADDRDPFQVRQIARCLTGRAILRQADRLGEAVEVLDAVIDSDRQDFNRLQAQLATATALDRQGNVEASQRVLTAIEGSEVVKANLLFRLLAVDLAHRLMLARAVDQPLSDQRSADIARAYELYEQLLSDTSLSQENAAALKRHIYARWESMVTTESDLSALPNSVLEAAGEMARVVGQAAVYEAEQLEAQGGQEERVAQLHDQARPKLNRSLLINTKLLERQNLTPRVQATAMFNLAMANYLLAQGDEEKLMAAADRWTMLAGQFSDQPIAEQAIALAIAVLHQLHALEPRPAGVDNAYEKSAGVLFEKFPAIEAADNERVYFAFYILSPRGQYAEAAQLLSKIPAGHRLYFEAQRDMLSSLKNVFDKAEKDADKEAARNSVTQHARRLIEQAEAVAVSEDPGKIKDARLAHGGARLILADMAISRNQIDQAQSLLDGFEETFREEPDLVRQALAKGIVMTAQAGKLGKLVQRAKAMMDLFPDDAAAVIDGVLSNITQRTDQLRTDALASNVQREKDQLLEQAGGLAEASQMLAELLLDWAVRQNMDQADLVPFKLLLAKATRLAGRPEGALDILRPLLEANPNDMDLIYHMAESLYAAGDEPSLIKAAEQYDRLIGGIGPPYPLVWWRAWLGRLQVMDRLNQSVEDIPLRVRALELTDPNLGGEPYRSEFKRLQLKHAQ